ncbi:hypothetical protein [uncultured Jatrophihabitans sp.]|uniref:hypothetical protein n=1 Tax=uncultured Jatrophihabitans sp. TaxID=1610747 RepID=UPI0035CA857D
MTSSPRQRAGVSAWLLVALLVACAVLAGLLELLLVPLRAGQVLIPVAVLFSIVSNIVLPRMAAALVPSVLAAALPFAGWLLVAVGFGLLRRPEGDVVLPAGGYVEYVGYATLLAGALAGTVTVVLAVPAGRAPPPRPNRDTGDATGGVTASGVRRGDRPGQ